MLCSPLVAASHCARQEPQDSLDNEVRYEPSKMRALDPRMYVGSLKQILIPRVSDFHLPYKRNTAYRDEAINR